VAETMTNEEAAALVTRNPVPPAERTIKTLEVDDGAPPAPDAAKPDVAALQAKLKAVESKNAEYKEALVKKDTAIADAKAAAKAVAAVPTQDAEDTKSNTDGPDIKALIAEATSKGVAEAMAAERKRNEPDARAVREFGKKQEAAEVVGEYGADVAEKYLDAAIETQKEYPGMTLVKAYKLVLPGDVKTAPKTPVESSRTPPPDVKPDSQKKAADLLAEAQGLNTRGARLLRRGILEDYVRVKAPSIFPDRGEG